MRDEALDVALRIRDLLKRAPQLRPAHPGPSAFPVAPVVSPSPDRRRRRTGDLFAQARLEPLQPDGAQSRSQNGDQAIILRIILVAKGGEGLIGEAFGAGFRGEGDRPEIRARLREDGADQAGAVVAAFRGGAGEGQQPPEEVERLGGSGGREFLDDGLALGLQILGEAARPAPVDEGTRSGEGRKVESSPFKRTLGYAECGWFSL